MQERDQSNVVKLGVAEDCWQIVFRLFYAEYEATAWLPLQLGTNRPEFQYDDSKRQELGMSHLNKHSS
jgi:hypothetical protein